MKRLRTYIHHQPGVVKIANDIPVGALALASLAIGS